MNDLSISLLNPPGERGSRDRRIIDSETYRDLGYRRILEAMAGDHKLTAAISAPAGELCQDIESIEYRLDVLEDMLGNPTLIDSVAALIPHIERLRFYVMHPGKTDATPLQETVWRLRELENYVACIDGLHDAFESGTVELKSTGLREFRRVIETTWDDEGYRQLRNELPSLLDPANAIRSLTVGINLNEGLIPIEAVVLSVRKEPFHQSTFLERIASQNETSTIGRLHSAKDSEFYADPSMIPLFRDIAKALNTSVRPLTRALKRFGRTNGTLFVKLMDEFVFYLGAVRLVRALRDRGLSMVRPIIRPAKDRIMNLRRMYNIDLALSAQSAVSMVTNDFTASALKRLFILTGPNSGGKTTFLQAIGLVQILAQIGLYVPAEYAEISLCDGVFTHYPSLEEAGIDSGRFGEEAERLRAIFGKVSGQSLLLLNETLSSTSMGEAVYLAEDLLRVLGRIGTRAIFVTHLHQLAAERDTIFADEEDSPVESIVAGTTSDGNGSVRPSFRVRPGEPLGKSYAAELAAKHGISGEQLMAMVSKDGS